MVWVLADTKEGQVDKLHFLTELVCLVQVSHLIYFFLT